MASMGLCFACTPLDLSQWPFSTFGGEGFSEPEHCFGQGDQPAPKGVMGGFICTCECRNRGPSGRVGTGANSDAQHRALRPKSPR